MGRFVSRDLFPGIVENPLTLNSYLYCNNNPVNFVDYFGLWYIDVNISGGFWGGFTGGVMISSQGAYPYFGGGAVVPPGVSGSITYSPQDPTPGWNFGGQISAVVAAQGGRAIWPGAGEFWELGIGGSWPSLLGVSLTGFYTWGPYRYSKPEKKDKKAGCNK